MQKKKKKESKQKLTKTLKESNIMINDILKMIRNCKGKLLSH